MKLLFNRWFYVLQDKAGGDGAGGGGGAGSGAGGDAGGSGAKSGDSDTKAQLADALAKIGAFEERFKKLEGNNSGGAGGKGDSKDLSDKAREEREAADKSNLNQKQLESAINFNLKAPQWLKDNAALLPKTIQGIFDQAAKENYANAIEKDSAIKVGVVSEFFSIQENADLLTESQRSALEDFRKLTKNVKQERAQLIYDTIFEPTFEMLKRVKKAEQLRKGIVEPNDSENAYKNKLVGLSRKHYLGEKQNGT